MTLTANVVASAPILSAWGNEIRNRTVQVFTSAAERDAQWTSPPNGAHAWLTTPKTLTIYNGTAWVCVTPGSASVATVEGPTTASYANLTTVGPVVTIQTGTSALITIAAQCSNNTAAQGCKAAVAITGATTLAAADARGVQATIPAATYTMVLSRTFLLTGLTAGVNVFTLQYAAGGGICLWGPRDLTVVGIP